MTLLLSGVGQAKADLMYNNGPINGTVDAWTISQGDQVSDSFTLSSATTVTGVQFGVWAIPGDTMTSVDWAISTGPTGGGVGDGSQPSGIIASGTASTSTAFQYTSVYGYDIDLINFSLSTPVAAGTYYLSLQNAVVPSGNSSYWDENEGPSTAYENYYGNLANASIPGTTGSESFQLYGSAVPEPSSARSFSDGLVQFDRVRMESAQAGNCLSLPSPVRLGGMRCPLAGFERGTGQGLAIHCCCCPCCWR